MNLQQLALLRKHFGFIVPPWSLCRLTGDPNLAITSFSITSTHVVAVWSDTAKISATL